MPDRQQGPPHILSIQDQFTRRVNGWAAGVSGSTPQTLTISVPLPQIRGKDAPIYLTDLIVGGGSASSVITITGPPEGPIVISLVDGDLEHNFTTPIASARGVDLTIVVAGTGTVSVFASGFHG